jgi:hypothetical protein
MALVHSTISPARWLRLAANCWSSCITSVSKVVLHVGDDVEGFGIELVVGHRTPLQRVGALVRATSSGIVRLFGWGCKAGSVAFADKLVHPKGDPDSDGDAAVGSATKVFAK